MVVRKTSTNIPLQGLVAFSSQGDRIALTQIEQLSNNHYVKLGYYDTQADNLTWLDREQWVGEYSLILWESKKKIITEHYLFHSSISKGINISRNILIDLRE